MLHLKTTRREAIFLFRAFFVLIFTFPSLNIRAQNITMINRGNDTTCSGTFLDPGGTGNYEGEDNTFVHTICSSTPGEFPMVDFTSFKLYISSSFCTCNGDVLEIFNGPSVNYPMINSYKDDELQGSQIYGSSGCLTFRFTTIASHSSDLSSLESINNPGESGWSGTITCVSDIPPTGENCFQANPFCSDQNYNFPNATYGSAPNKPNYGCLANQPRPIWYYLKIGQAGTLELGLSQTSHAGVGIDVDYAMWGPFSDIPSGCADIMSGKLAPLQCSCSTSTTESIGIGTTGGTAGGQTKPPAAQEGEYYIVIITNYNGAAGNISLNQTGGDGTTDCSIIEPSNITNITANRGTSDPNDNHFSDTGEVTFENGLSSGNVIAEDDNEKPITEEWKAKNMETSNSPITMLSEGNNEFVTMASVIVRPLNTPLHGTLIKWGILDQSNDHDYSFYRNVSGIIHSQTLKVRFPKVKRVLTSIMTVDEDLAPFLLTFGAATGLNETVFTVRRPAPQGFQLVGNGTNWTASGSFSNVYELDAFNSGLTTLNLDQDLTGFDATAISITYTGSNNYRIQRKYDRLGGSAGVGFYLVDIETNTIITTPPTANDYVHITNYGQGVVNVRMDYWITRGGGQLGNEFLSGANFWSIGMYELWMKAAPISSTEIEVIWQKKSGVTEYKLLRSRNYTVDVNGDYVLTNPTTVYTGTDLQFTDTGLTSNTMYYYQLTNQSDVEITQFNTKTL